MRVTTYGETSPDIEPSPDRPVIVYTPFRAIEFGRNSELRIDLSESPGGARAVSTRFFRSGGRGRPMQPDRPMHLSPETLVALIATLTEAAVAIGAMPSAPTAAESGQAEAFRRRVADVAEAHARGAEIDRMAKQIDNVADMRARADEIGRSIEDHARATGQDPAGYVVLTPDSPEWLQAERDLMHARAL